MKKIWEKPKCQKVNLVPEEAVLWGCKAVGGPIARIGFLGTCILLGDACVSPTS